VKTSQDQRHLKREAIIKELFTWGFTEKFEAQTKETKEIVKSLNKIDKEIENGAPSWPINQINRIDLAILRLAVFELIIVKDVPFKVVVDEAVEMAKKYGAQSSPSFVNGVLGNIITAHKIIHAEDFKSARNLFSQDLPTETRAAFQKKQELYKQYLGIDFSLDRNY